MKYTVSDIAFVQFLNRQMSTCNTVIANLETRKKETKSGTKERREVNRRLARERKLLSTLREQRKENKAPSPLTESEAIYFMQSLVRRILKNAELAIEEYHTALAWRGITRATESAAAAIGGEYILDLFAKFEKWDWRYEGAIVILTEIAQEAREKAERVDPLTIGGNVYQNMVQMTIFSQARDLAGLRKYTGESVPDIIREAEKHITPGLEAGRMLAEADDEYKENWPPADESAGLVWDTNFR